MILNSLLFTAGDSDPAGKKGGGLSNAIKSHSQRRGSRNYRCDTLIGGH